MRVRKMAVFRVVLQADGQSAPRCARWMAVGCCCWMTLLALRSFSTELQLILLLHWGNPKLLAFQSFRLPVSLFAHRPFGAKRKPLPCQGCHSHHQQGSFSSAGLFSGCDPKAQGDQPLIARFPVFGFGTLKDVPTGGVSGINGKP